MVRKFYQAPETRLAQLPYVRPLCLSPDTQTSPVTEEEFDFEWDD